MRTFISILLNVPPNPPWISENKPHVIHSANLQKSIYISKEKCLQSLLSRHHNFLHRLQHLEVVKGPNDHTNDIKR